MPARERVITIEGVPVGWPFAEYGPRITLRFIGSGVDWQPGEVHRHVTGAWFLVMLRHDERNIGGRYIAPVPILTDPISWSA